MERGPADTGREERIRFDDFEFDPGSGELFCKGAAVRIQPQPLRVLRILLERPGQTVSREELRNLIWGDTTYVEFDQGLNYCIRQIRVALGDSATNPVYVETLPRQGYRFLPTPIHSPPTRVHSDGRGVALNSGPAEGVLEAPPVPAADAPPPARFAPSPAPNPAAPAPFAPSNRRRIAWAVTAGLGACLAVAGWNYFSSPPRIRSLAVLPLENLSGDPAQDYFADGMTDQLITELASIRDLRVVSRTSAMQEKGRHRPLRQIADELRVDAVVEGSIVRSEDKIRITAQLIDARTDRHLWARSFEGRDGDVLALQDSVAGEIASQTRTVLLPAHRSPARRVDPAAHDAYLRARYFFDKQDFLRSASYFEKAISIDGSYAPAYAGLAESLDAEPTFQLASVEEVEPKALAAARRAIELDPGDGEAYTALGSIQTIYLWDWPDAEQNLKRGVELSPSDSLSEMKYAVWLDAMGRPEEAVAHMRRAVDCDPRSFYMTRRLGATLYYARRYAEALDALQRASEMEPNQAASFDNYRSRIYEMEGLYAQAVDYDLSALHRGQPKADTAALRSVYQRGGWAAYWQARIAALDPSADRWCGAYEFGTDSLRMGDRDKAFLYLNRTIDRHCFYATWFQVDPILDALRGDPRYKSLLRRLGLPG